MIEFEISLNSEFCHPAPNINCKQYLWKEGDYTTILLGLIISIKLTGQD